MKKPYPSLSTKGWIEDVPGVLDAVTANFLLTHPSLSVEFNKVIKALPAIIQQYGNSETDIQRELGADLETLFARYFEKPIVEARVSYPDPDDLTRMAVSVFISVERDGQSYNVAREISVANNKVVGVMEINNG